MLVWEERARGKATTDRASSACHPPGDTPTYLFISPCQMHPSDIPEAESVSVFSKSEKEQMPPTLPLYVLDL